MTVLSCYCCPACGFVHRYHRRCNHFVGDRQHCNVIELTEALVIPKDQVILDSQDHLVIQKRDHVAL